MTAHFKACVPSLRIDTHQRAVDVVLVMNTAQNINHRDLGPHLPATSTPEAKKRRMKRAVHDEQLTAQVFLALLLVHLPSGEILMSVARTTWEHGDTPLNLLVLGAVAHSFTIPLVWMALDHLATATPGRAGSWVATPEVADRDG